MQIFSNDEHMHNTSISTMKMNNFTIGKSHVNRSVWMRICWMLFLLIKCCMQHSILNAYELMHIECFAGQSFSFSSFSFCLFLSTYNFFPPFQLHHWYCSSDTCKHEECVSVFLSFFKSIEFFIKSHFSRNRMSFPHISTLTKPQPPIDRTVWPADYPASMQK